MSHIVYCWENGANQGHLIPARPILAELLRRGHVVSAVLKDMRPAETNFDGLGIRFYQAPRHRGRPPGGPGSSTFAWQLAAAGFASPEESGMAFGAWRSLFQLLRPDFALLDYSPLAALALRGSDTRTAQFGTGICCPPPVVVPRVADPDEPKPVDAPEDDQAQIVETMNHHLRTAGQAEVGRISDLTAGLDETFLTTYPELDHYSRQEGVKYWGAWADSEAARPDWPDTSGRRAFAYLHWFKDLHVLFNLFNYWEISTVAYGYAMPEAVRKQFSSKYLRLESTRVSLPHAAKNCDFAVTHGNHGSTAYLLSQGVPLFMLPLQKEMEFTARRVSELGAGKWSPPKQPETFARQFGAVAMGGTCRTAAVAVAQKWGSVDADASPTRIADRIEELLA